MSIPAVILISKKAIRIASQNDLDNIVFQPNKTYLFKSGQQFSFNETLNISNLELGIYGGTDYAIFDGSTDISTATWTDEGDGIYSTPFASKPKWILINDVLAKQAETSWIGVTDKPSGNQLSFNSSAISQYSSIIGASLVAEDRPFSYSLEHIVINYSSGTLTLDSDITYSESGRFKLFGLLEFIASNNEWAYEDGRLYVKTPSNPSGLNIRKIDYDIGLNNSGNGFQIDGIHFQNYYQHGIKNTGNNFLLQNFKTNNIRDSAIFIPNQKTGVTIRNGIIEDVGNNGIQLSSPINCLIQNIEINRIGKGENIGWQTYPVLFNGSNTSTGEGCGIRFQLDFDDDSLYGQNITISNNRISNTAYNGISVNVGDSVLIEKNIVSDFCELLSDGGGIYVFRARNQNDGIIAEIRNNIVYNTNSKTGLVMSCYLDNRSYQCHVHHNVFFNSFGFAEIFINNDTREHIIEDNIVCSNDGQAILYNEFGPSAIYSQGDNTNRRNVYSVKKSNIFCHDNDLGTGIFTQNDFNYYISPYSANVARRSGTPLTFAQLQAEYSDDTNSVSKSNWLTYVNQSVAEEHVKLYTNETGNETTIIAPSGYEDINGNDVSGQQLTVPAYYGLLLLKSAD